MPRNSEIKVGKWSVWYLSRSQHNGSNFQSGVNLLEILGFQTNVFVCFDNIEKAYNWVPCDNLRKVLQKYEIDECLLKATESLYCQPEVCVRVNGKQSKSFHVRVGLGRGCVSHFSLPYMKWVDKLSKPMSVSRSEDARIVDCFLAAACAGDIACDILQLHVILLK